MPVVEENQASDRSLYDCSRRCDNCRYNCKQKRFARSNFILAL